MPTSEELFAQLIERSERETPFDLEGFLADHASDAVELRERWALLVEAGLLPQAHAGRLSDDAWLNRAVDLLERQDDEGDPLCHRIDERYELGATIAQGGMGIVQQAFDRVLGRSVAIKILHLSGLRELTDRTRRRVLGRFLTEARVTASADSQRKVTHLVIET